MCLGQNVMASMTIGFTSIWCQPVLNYSKVPTPHQHSAMFIQILRIHILELTCKQVTGWLSFVSCKKKSQKKVQGNCTCICSWCSIDWLHVMASHRSGMIPSLWKLQTNSFIGWWSRMHGLIDRTVCDAGGQYCLWEWMQYDHIMPVNRQVSSLYPSPFQSNVGIETSMKQAAAMIHHFYPPTFPNCTITHNSSHWKSKGGFCIPHYGTLSIQHTPNHSPTKPKILHSSFASWEEIWSWNSL